MFLVLLKVYEFKKSEINNLLFYIFIASTKKVCIINKKKIKTDTEWLSRQEYLRESVCVVSENVKRGIKIY